MLRNTYRCNRDAAERLKYETQRRVGGTALALGRQASSDGRSVRVRVPHSSAPVATRYTPDPSRIDRCEFHTRNLRPMSETTTIDDRRRARSRPQTAPHPENRRPRPRRAVLVGHV
ncbi:hypothetical protein QZM22_20460 [Burkholderia oklahomensis]|uniref:hypothetical protein n=1 Tax=Burkholderia oklahomensis TaxID=342113 RepID=UPI00265496E3|nr:hypothetical protein [Burkholderia oklahomensis]MDN7674831.1 hypothetical protein [Burkholderia oklahomensis]